MIIELCIFYSSLIFSLFSFSNFPLPTSYFLFPLFSFLFSLSFLWRDGICLFFGFVIWDLFFGICLLFVVCDLGFSPFCDFLFEICFENTYYPSSLVITVV
jgi:hypothetical protein